MPGTCKEFYMCIAFDPGDKTRCVRQTLEEARLFKKGCVGSDSLSANSVSVFITRAYTQVTKQLPVLVLFLGKSVDDSSGEFL